MELLEGWTQPVGYATDVAVSPDGQVVAIVSESGREAGGVYVWTFRHGRSGWAHHVRAEVSGARWPSMRVENAGGTSIACQVPFRPDQHQPWEAFVLGVHGTVPVGVVGSDRGVRINDDGAIEQNIGVAGNWKYSAQGIGTFAGGKWFGADELRILWQHEPNFYATDMTDDGAWVIGNNTEGPDRTFLIHTATRARYLVFEGLAFEPRVAWDGRGWICAVASGDRGALRRAGWTLDELETRRVRETMPMPTVLTIVEYQRAVTAPARVAFSYRAEAVIRPQQRIRPVGVDTWQSAPIGLSAQGFSEFEVRDPWTYEIGLVAEDPATGAPIVTQTRRTVTVQAAPVLMPEVITSEEWRALEVEVSSVVAALRDVVLIGTDAARWEPRYVELRMVEKLTQDVARRRLVDEITAAAVARLRGEA